MAGNLPTHRRHSPPQAFGYLTNRGTGGNPPRDVFSFRQGKGNLNRAVFSLKQRLRTNFFLFSWTPRFPDPQNTESAIPFSALARKLLTSRYGAPSCPLPFREADQCGLYATTQRVLCAPAQVRGLRQIYVHGQPRASPRMQLCVRPFTPIGGQVWTPGQLRSPHRLHCHLLPHWHLKIF
jgi:hypothetical protein